MDDKWYPFGPLATTVTRTPQELAFINGFVMALYWLWSRGYVETSDRVIEAMREHRYTIEDLKEADVDAHVVQALKDRGAPYRG